jgi:putative pyruvate formate lyase activating enzyme
MRSPTEKLEETARKLRALLSPCRLCPNACGVDRLSGEIGRCGVGPAPRVASFGPHFGEESALVGDRGSGTVFFSGCSLACVYCQNWTISQGREGADLTEAELADLFLQVRDGGCANLNLVTPTHQAHAIVAGLAIATAHGFDLPIVWNCGGYESLETLRLLDGIVDVYMPDLKYGSDEVARRLSGVTDYVQVSQRAVLEMHRQVGVLRIDPDGLARRGVLVRHLVLPNGLAGSREVMRFLASISREAYVNLMDQYRPCHRAGSFPDLGRRVAPREFTEAVRAARDAGIHRLA